MADKQSINCSSGPRDSGGESGHHEDSNNVAGTSDQHMETEKYWTPPTNWELAPEFVPTIPVSFPKTTRVWELSAPEFVPRTANELAPTTETLLSQVNTIPSEDANHVRSYAEVVGPSQSSSEASGSATGTGASSNPYEMCPYAMFGECRYGDQCLLVHGLMCDFCGQACLHPTDMAQREKHSRECVQQHERDMEHSFAVARSNDKTCGVCMEVILEKMPAGEQRFGILPSCNHCFCLSCIRKWRQARQFDNKIIRACPECRVTSDFVCPSRFWVETKEEKDKLIQSYKVALSQKSCRYYRSGSGVCPFGNKCFYLHALADGTQVDVGPPRRRRRRHNAQDGQSAHNQSLSIWEFLEEWELQWMDIEDFIEMLDSDSEWSDMDEEYEELV